MNKYWLQNDLEFLTPFEEIPLYLLKAPPRRDWKFNEHKLFIIKTDFFNS